MTLLLLLSAVLYGAIGPIDLPSRDETARFLALSAGEYAVVAMIPEQPFGHEERVRVLSDAAAEVASATGKCVVLTDDLLAYLSIKRMLTRGVGDYERRALAARLSRAEHGLYRASPSRSD